LRKAQIVGGAQVVIVRGAGKLAQSVTLTNVTFELKDYQRRLFAIWIAAWLALYSEASTSIIVPWLLAISALAICIHQQISTW
jgi:hypothetical protein